MKYRECGWILLTVLMLHGCLVKTPVADITAAENIRQTSDGRIFITGRHGLYELQQQDDGSFGTTQIHHTAQCSYHAGLTQLQDWLFFVCVRQNGLNWKTLKFADSGELMAYSLSDSRVVSLMPLSGYQFANGLDALTSDNAILIADEDFLRARGGVSKALIDFSGTEPVVADYQHLWIGREHGVYAANGVRVKDSAVYLTDIGRLKRVPLDASGAPQQAQTLYRDRNVTVLDDLDIWCNGFLVADFIKGRLVYVPEDGSAAVVSPAGLASPSAVLAQPTSYFGNDVLITESTGLQPGTGNKLVRLSGAQLNIEECTQ